MSEFDRLDGSNIEIGLDFVERSIHRTSYWSVVSNSSCDYYHFLILYLSWSVSGVKRAHSTVRNWVQKADFQQTDGAQLDHAALEETVIQLGEHRYWLHTTVDPTTNAHIRLYSATTTALTERFLQELSERYTLDDAVFLVDRAKHLQTSLRRFEFRFRYEKHRGWNSAKRIFYEIKRRTCSFSNGSSHAKQSTVESWLQAFPSGIILQTGYDSTRAHNDTISNSAYES